MDAAPPPTATATAPEDTLFHRIPSPNKLAFPYYIASGLLLFNNQMNEQLVIVYR